VPQKNKSQYITPPNTHFETTRTRRKIEEGRPNFPQQSVNKFERMNFKDAAEE
jgi:hypothetical protein